MVFIIQIFSTINCRLFHSLCLQVNYSRLIHELDGEMKGNVESARHLPRIVDKTLRLLNLKQVMAEVETSVMSKVSCTACRAGKFLLFLNNEL